MFDTFWGALYSLKDPYQNNPVRIVLEIVLLGLVLKYAFSQQRKGRRTNEIILSPEQIEQVIKEWEPKEMGIDVKEEAPAQPRYFLSSFNVFLFNGALSGTKHGSLPEDGLPGERPEDTLRKKALLRGIIDKYGVGTCGPRGFYGTLDLQITLEESLARSLGVEGVVLYAHALLAVSSVIKCFCKKSDVIFYDHRSSVSIRRGIYASRAKAISYSSPEDLNSKLSLEGTRRKFIMTEGIFEETGETADIGAVVRAKRAHKAFLLLDESISIPMLGSRGCVGFFGINPKEIDLWIGSLASGYGSAGGFCGSTAEISSQQRLSSLAYCFSASMPAFLTYFAQLNLESVHGWEKKYQGQLKHEAESSTEEESSSEFSYVPEIEFPRRKSLRSPKFARSCQRENNPLVNYQGARALMKCFNKKAQRATVPARAKHDLFTPIVQIVFLEECENRSDMSQRVHRKLQRSGILTRATNCPEPAILAIVDNSLSIKTAEVLGEEMLKLIAPLFLAPPSSER
ncbi:serine palmitoyltransferase [Nematocida displodere]|uniref:serine C-palmitoyltransferase n=1 Tax=Nematocida displodere TaxID=1805483 RepID=A0A177ECZ9_9MICR|nr:serine palmitoyltransferase [Nematocida displodere]